MKKIYRQQQGRMVAGVCAGLGEYFNIDPSIFRIAAVIFGFTGMGILAYIICAIILPEAPL